MNTHTQRQRERGERDRVSGGTYLACASLPQPTNQPINYEKERVYAPIFTERERERQKRKKIQHMIHVSVCVSFFFLLFRPFFRLFAGCAR